MTVASSDVLFSPVGVHSFLGRMIQSIPRGYPLSLGRHRRGVLHGCAGGGADFLDLFEGAIASIGVVACLCCRNYSRR